MPLVPVLMKKLRLQEHIKWAAENETLDSVYKLLKSLAHDDGLGLKERLCLTHRWCSWNKNDNLKVHK